MTKQKTPADYAALLRTGRWFAALPVAFAEALVGAARLVALAPGETLFSRGDPPTGIFACLDGALRVGGVAEDGRESLLILLGPPHWFGEISVLDGQPRTHDAVGDVASLVLHVPQPALDEMFAREPGWWRFIGLLVASKLRLAFDTMEEVAMLPLGMRLARRLALMAQAYGEQRGPTRRRLEVSQDDLALMLSTSRQTVNALLKDLEQRGLIKIARAAVEILDVAGLQKAAELPGF